VKEVVVVTENWREKKKLTASFPRTESNLNKSFIRSSSLKERRKRKSERGVERSDKVTNNSTC
jgi:hypothetical protein